MIKPVASDLWPDPLAKKSEPAMEILFVLIAGYILGTIARYSLPGRELVGAVLVPLVATGFAGIVWEIMLWSGLRPDNAWMWVATLVLTAVAAVALNIILVRRRRQSDDIAFEAALKG
jgi:uncharacterized membrane protein YeaQ/YmgE (transglycosylase-associated protein family)